MSSFEKFQRFLITVLFILGAFYGGFYFGKRGFLVEIKKNPPKVEIINRSPAEQKVDMAQFWKVWDMVSAEFLLRPVDSNKMLQGAIVGMVQSLEDPYTAYLPPKVNEAVNDSLHGNYQGIGAELAIKNGNLIVVAPIDGSPAKAAGIKAGDKILAIDDKTTQGLSVTEAVSQIRGEAATKVKLTIQTGDEAPRDLELTRQVITLPSVSWQDKGDGTAYLRISRFYGGESNAEWDKVIADLNLNMKELDTIIVDLRDNPGGYLQTSVYMAEEFFTDKVVVYQEDALGKQTPFKADRVGAFHNVPAVFVLINNGSASASEILAAALRDNVKAKIIGTKSFGKGTIQTAQDFGDGSGIHITVAKWLTPEKFWVGNGGNNAIGLTPDETVELTDDDRNNARDPQLDKAIELAKQI
jgi:carboxyl-terminal processing protease